MYALRTYFYKSSRQYTIIEQYNDCNNKAIYQWAVNRVRSQEYLLPERLKLCLSQCDFLSNLLHISPYTDISQNIWNLQIFVVYICQGDAKCRGIFPR